MDRSERDEQFHEFVSGHRPRLLRTAMLLTVRDAHLAEDLVQTTLTKLYVVWPVFQRADNPEGYLRRVMANALIDERRRIWRRKEKSVAELPERAISAPDVDVNEAVRDALRKLPPRMRAAVLFRHYYGLNVAETADALRCTSGTVKSQTARGLDRIRAVLARSSPSQHNKEFSNDGATS